MNSNDETILVFRNTLNGGIKAKQLPIGKCESGKEFDEGFRLLILFRCGGMNNINFL
jgi:hypothetical protein